MSHKVSKTTLDSRFTIFREVYENPLLYREKNTFLKIKEVKKAPIYRVGVKPLFDFLLVAALFKNIIVLVSFILNLCI